MIRVLHVEDSPNVRRGFATLVSRAEGFSMVGSAGSVAEAEQLLQDGVDFEVAAVDLGLPDGSGLDVIRSIREVRPEATVLAFTVFDDPGHVFDALRAGARGYVLKHTEPTRLLNALREVVSGGSPLTPAIARRVVESFAARPDEEPDVELSAREVDVLELLVEGRTYAQIASALDVTLSTVQTHVKSIYAKLEVSSKAEATRLAIRKGLVKP